MEMDKHGRMDDQGSMKMYSVVVNEDEQYSIWPLDRELPAGWNRVDRAENRQACLDRIAAVWTDIRPRGLRTRSTR